MPLGVWSSSKISEMAATWELSNHSRWELMLRGNKPHKQLTQFVQSNFSIQIQHLKYKKYDTLFIGDHALENKKQG